MNASMLGSLPLPRPSPSTITGRAAVDRRAVLLEELPEREPVVASSRPRPAGRRRTPGPSACSTGWSANRSVISDQVGHERERPHLPEQVLQAVHQVQGEPGRRPHRQRHVGQHDQPRLVLRAPHRDRVERDAVEAHVAAHRPAGVDPPAGGDPALVGQRAVQRLGQPAQRLLQLHPLGLADPVDLGRPARLAWPSTIRCSSSSSVSRWSLIASGRPASTPVEPAAQRGRVVLGARPRGLAPRRRSASPAARPAGRPTGRRRPWCPGPARCRRAARRRRSRSVSICTRLPSVTCCPGSPWRSTISSVIAARSILLASWCRLYCWARSSGSK